MVCRITSIAAGAQHTMLLTVEGTLMAFGENKHGCLGTGDTDNTFVPTEVEARCCIFFSIARNEDAEFFYWVHLLCYGHCISFIRASFGHIWHTLVTRRGIKAKPCCRVS